MTILRKAKVPYSRQPPSTVIPDWDSPLSRGLTYASSIPYEKVYKRTLRGQVPVLVTGSDPLGYINKAGLGKTAQFSTGIQALETPALTYVDPPFTVLVGFNLSTLGNDHALLSFQGGGVNGWTIRCNASNQIDLVFGGVNVYTFTGLTVAANIDYFVCLTITGQAGTATPYLIRKDTNVISTDTGLTVGTLIAAGKPLTIGMDFDGTSYSDPFEGAIGSFALWNRSLSVSEIFSLLINPYQIWSIRDDQKINSAVDLTFGITTNQATSSVGTIIPNNSFNQTGNSSTLSIGNINAGPDVTVGLISLTMTMVAGFISTPNTVVLSSGQTTGLVGNVLCDNRQHGVVTLTIVNTATISNTPTALIGSNSNSSVGTIVASGATGVTVDLINNITQLFVGNLIPQKDLSLITDVFTGFTGNINGGQVVNQAITGISNLGQVGNIVAVNPTKTLALSGIDFTGFVGSADVSISSKTFNLTGTSITGFLGAILTVGGQTPNLYSGTNSYNKEKFKRTKVPIDYSLQWLLKVLGSEESYFRPKIKLYYPQISENNISNVISNIIIEMRHYFVSHSNDLTDEQIRMKENITIKFYALKMLNQYNATIKIDETPYTPGLLS